MKATNIGPGDSRFNSKYPDFTQVIVENSDGEFVAHFCGPGAKINAGRFIVDWQKGEGELNKCVKSEPLFPKIE